MKLDTKAYMLYNILIRSSKQAKLVCGDTTQSNCIGGLVVAGGREEGASGLLVTVLYIDIGGYSGYVHA